MKYYINNKTYYSKYLKIIIFHMKFEYYYFSVEKIIYNIMFFSFLIFLVSK